MFVGAFIIHRPEDVDDEMTLTTIFNTRKEVESIYLVARFVHALLLQSKFAFI